MGEDGDALFGAAFEEAHGGEGVGGEELEFGMIFEAAGAGGDVGGEDFFLVGQEGMDGGEDEDAVVAAAGFEVVGGVGGGREVDGEGDAVADAHVVHVVEDVGDGVVIGFPGGGEEHVEDVEGEFFLEFFADFGVVEAVEVEGLVVGGFEVGGAVADVEGDAGAPEVGVAEVGVDVDDGEVAADAGFDAQVAGGGDFEVGKAREVEEVFEAEVFCGYLGHGGRFQTPIIIGASNKMAILFCRKRVQPGDK